MGCTAGSSGAAAAAGWPWARRALPAPALGHACTGEGTASLLCTAPCGAATPCPPHRLPPAGTARCTAIRWAWQQALAACSSSTAQSSSCSCARPVPHMGTCNQGGAPHSTLLSLAPGQLPHRPAIPPCAGLLSCWSTAAWRTRRTGKPPPSPAQPCRPSCRLLLAPAAMLAAVYLPAGALLSKPAAALLTCCMSSAAAPPPPAAA